MSSFFRDFLDGFKPLEAPSTTGIPASSFEHGDSPGSDEEKMWDHKGALSSDEVQNLSVLDHPDSTPVPDAAQPEKLKRHLGQRHMQMIAFGGRCVSHSPG